MYRHCVAFLAHRHNLMRAVRSNGEVRHLFNAVRQVNNDRVVDVRSRVGAKGSREVSGGLRRTLQHHRVNGAVLRVLAVVHHSRLQFAVQPFAVVQPFNGLRLVMYRTGEFQCRYTHDNLVVRQRVRKRVAALHGGLAVHFGCRQFRVIDEAEVAYLQVRITRCTAAIHIETATADFAGAHQYIQLAYHEIV